MKKTIKIRFIEHTSLTSGRFCMQVKGFFGWRTCGFHQAAGYGDSIWTIYYGDDPQKLLEEILENKYLTSKNFVRIQEFPTIKIY